MRYQIQKLGVGQILDQSINVVKDNLGLLFGLYAIVLPFQLAAAYFDASAQVGDPVGNVLVVALVKLLGGIAGIVFNAAVIHGIASLYISRATSFGDCVQAGMKRFFPLLWTGILTGIACVFGFILLIIPGIIFAVWFCLAQEITVIEHISGSDAMGRSKKLMRGNFGKAVVLGLVFFAINIGVGMGAVMLVTQPVIMAIMITIAQGISTILGSAVLVILYFSARCEHENFDLQMLTSAVAEDFESPR